MRLDGIGYRQIPPRELRRARRDGHPDRVSLSGNDCGHLRFGPVQQGIELPAGAIETLLIQVGLAGRAGEDCRASFWGAKGNGVPGSGPGDLSGGLAAGRTDVVA